MVRGARRTELCPPYGQENNRLSIKGRVEGGRLVFHRATDCKKELC